MSSSSERTEAELPQLTTAKMACRACNSTLALFSRRAAPSLRPALPILRAIPPVRHINTAPPSNPQPAAATTQSTPATGPPPKKQSIARLVSAQKLRPGGITAAYSIYHGTDRLCQLLCAQADYTIDSAARRSGALKHTEEGEELGSGETIWHTGRSLSHRLRIHS